LQFIDEYEDPLTFVSNKSKYNVIDK